jgi:hypothetical protein
MKSESQGNLIKIATMCHASSTCCPTMFVDTSAPENKKVLIKDDFGSSIQMSPDQLNALISLAKEDKLSIGK